MKFKHYALLISLALLSQGALAQTVQIGNFVWNDLNGNGIQDAGEPGIPDVTVSLSGTDQGGNPVNLNTTTDANGMYLFGTASDNLGPGTYQLTFAAPAGYSATAQNQGGHEATDSSIDPTTGMTANTTLVSGESDFTWDAGYFRPAALKSFVWNDLNKNGFQDAGEPGLPNQQATLTGSTGDGTPVNLSRTSDASGIFFWENLEPGTYRATFTYPAGCQTASLRDQGANDAVDSDIDLLTLRMPHTTLASGEINETYDAGFYEGTLPSLSSSQCGPGQITATIQSSIHPPVNYLWDSGTGSSGSGTSTQATFTIASVPSGTYTVTTTDAIGCSATASATVVVTPVISLSANITPVSCFGGSNGAIDLTVAGGTPNYSYNWGGGITTEDRTGLVAGVYAVTVTDATGCTQILTIVVSGPAPFILSTVVTPPSCIIGGSSGAIDLTVTGGTFNYTYIWSPGGITTQDLSSFIDQPLGTYCVTVTDDNGCTATTCATISAPPSLAFSIASLSQNCNSEVLTGPNFPNISYQWTGPNGFTTTAKSITAPMSGTYSLTVTSNISGCTATDTYLVQIGSNPCGYIKGRVVQDLTVNCLSDPGEPALSGWLLRAEGTDTLYGTTDSLGRYYIGAYLGTYTLRVLPPNGLWTACPSGPAVTLTVASDTVSGGDLMVQSPVLCPSLTVSISTIVLRRCFSGNTYQVQYCNQGTAPATDAFVLVTLDPFLTYLSSSIPSTDLGNNVRRFAVGNLAVGQCGSFGIDVKVECTATLGQTHCTEAHIYPDTLCVPTSPNWSGASLDVRGVCNGDSLIFIIKNVGKNATSSNLEYIVVEDAVMRMTAPLQTLSAGDSVRIALPANGSTWRIEVDQEAFHPNPAPQVLSVEGCTSNLTFSTGFVNQFTVGDEAQYVDIDCTPNVGSYDPNDKQGFPNGYGVQHYIRPGTDIEYLIRFQNTGTDTAFTVRIIDTLSAWLDPASIRFGASSHAYRYDLCGEGVVHFIFENILLADSNVNEAASHGFVRFHIRPRADAPLESLIENRAAIYFDFNDPVMTNTTFHRLGENFITSSAWQPAVPGAEVSAAPNPFGDATVLEVKGLRQSGPLRLRVTDLLGHVVQEMDSEGAVFHLKRGAWPTGVYLFSITQGGLLVGSGKLVAE